MKLLLLSIAAILLCACGSCQTSARGEFAINANGLMYNDADIKLLRHIVDSLDLKFKSCDLNRKYYSLPQGKIITLEFASTKNNLAAVRKAMDEGKTPDEIIKAFKRQLESVDSGHSIIKTDNVYEGAPYFLYGEPSKGYDEWPGNWEKKIPKANEWAYTFSEKDEYDKNNTVTGWYLPTQMRQRELPIEYARLVQYVDCMIDTSMSIFLPGKETDRSAMLWLRDTALRRIANYIYKAQRLPVVSDKISYVQLTKEDVLFAKSELGNDKGFIALLLTTANESIEINTGDDHLEELAEALISKEKALQMKRSRRVIGRCSADDSPRWHALGIAKLAASAHCWDIFLRAHLNIMNDRFERMSDGSYAWNQRKTYLRELEELDLNVVDLMLGLTLRAKDLSDNHYYGTVWRLGWALTESKERNRFEKQALQMMKDERLDEFNRGLIFMLYHTYLSRLDNIDEANQKITALKKDKILFSSALQQGIENMEKVKPKK